MRHRTAVLVLMLHVMVLSLTGCGTSILSFRDSNPIIQDYAGVYFGDKHLLTFATKASHRMVLVRHDLTPNTKEGLTQSQTISCAEPSPDAAEAIHTAVAGALKFITPQKISFEGQLEREIATQVAPLVYRSQALQLYRDEIHRLCIARMNEWITNKDYLEASTKRFDDSLKAVSKEIEGMAEAQKVLFALKVGSGSLRERAEVTPNPAKERPDSSKETPKPGDKKPSPAASPDPKSP